MLRFRKVPLAKKFKDKRGEGRVSSFSVEKTLAHSGKRFRRRGGGSIKIFRRNCFVSHCRKFPLGNHLVFR